MDSGSDKLFRNLERMAKKHKVECDLILNGSRAARVMLSAEKDRIVAHVRITDLKKVLTTPELFKIALSFMAQKKSVRNKIDIKIETGILKRLFGRNS